MVGVAVVLEGVAVGVAGFLGCVAGPCLVVVVVEVEVAVAAVEWVWLKEEWAG